MSDAREAMWRSAAARRLAILAVVVAALLAVYGQVGRHAFLAWDDQQHVVDNPHLNPVTAGGVAQFWQRPYWGLYIPASYTLFAAEAAISQGLSPDGQLQPAVFHWGNLLLHVGCVLLVYSILKRLVEHDLAALAGALLFGLHPLQVESVAWVSEARGLLCGLFALAAIRLYLAGREPGAPAVRWYVAATAAFVLALLSKPAAVAVPLMVLVLELGWFRATPLALRPSLLALRLLPWFLLAGGFVVLNKLQQPDTGLPFTVPLAERPLVAGDALVFYLEKLIAPLGLVPDYSRTPASVLAEWSAYCVWLVPLALAAALACVRNRRVWLTAAGLFAAWLLPTLGFVPFVYQRISTVADRYVYLALLGPALALAWVLARYRSRLAVVVVALGLLLLGWLSQGQTACWRDDDALLLQTLAVNPQSAMGCQHRGELLVREGKHIEALGFYRRALAGNPQLPELHVSLGTALAATGQTAAGLDELRAAVRLAPGWAMAHYNLAHLLARVGKIDEAAGEYREALRLDPRYAKAYLSLGKLLADHGAPALAAQEYRRALEAAPGYVEAHVNLGEALQSLGRTTEARQEYEQALALRDDWAPAHFNLGNLALAAGEVDRAAEHYRAAIDRNPEYAKAHVNLAAALTAQGHAAEAVEHCRTALRTSPALPEAQVNLGRALDAMRRHKEAAAAYRAALGLLPPGSPMARQVQELLSEKRE